MPQDGRARPIPAGSRDFDAETVRYAGGGAIGYPGSSPGHAGAGGRARGTVTGWRRSLPARS